MASIVLMGEMGSRDLFGSSWLTGQPEFMRLARPTMTSPRIMRHTHEPVPAPSRHQPTNLCCTNSSHQRNNFACRSSRTNFLSLSLRSLAVHHFLPLIESIIESIIVLPNLRCHGFSSSMFATFIFEEDFSGSTDAPT